MDCKPRDEALPTSFLQNESILITVRCASYKSGMQTATYLPQSDASGISSTKLQAPGQCIVTRSRYGQHGNHGSIRGIGKGFFSSTQRPYCHCSSPTFLLNGYRDFFLRGSGQCVKLTAYIHAVSRWRMSGAVPILPPYASTACTGSNFTFYVKLLLQIVNLTCYIIIIIIIIKASL